MRQQINHLLPQASYPLLPDKNKINPHHKSSLSKIWVGISRPFIAFYFVWPTGSANSLARQRAQRLNRTKVFDFHRCHTDRPFVQVDHLASQHGIVTRIEQ